MFVKTDMIVHSQKKMMGPVETLSILPRQGNGTATDCRS
jgi:hypothetical protein